MAFPTTPLLDDFSRAAEGPPPSASWNGTYSCWPGRSSAMLKVNASQQLVTDGGEGSMATNYFDTSYGPDSEAYVTVVTRPNNYGWTGLFCRVQAGGVDTSYYAAMYNSSDSAGTLQIFKRVTGTGTQLGADVSFWLTAGDRIGLAVVGSATTTVNFYRKPAAGSWTLIATRDDSSSPITGAGFIGVLSDINGVLDDFGGGAVRGIASPLYVYGNPAAGPGGRNPVSMGFDLR